MRTVFIDLFSGIGGFAIAAYWAGLRFDDHYFSEIENYAIQVYKKRFPKATGLGDIKKVDWRKLCKEINKEGPAQAIVAGGFP
jgi:site-specific DNA-cytosine methylase